MVKIVALKDFPKAAQFLPSHKGLKEDTAVELEVVECSYCGLVQLTNEPVDYYKDVITTASLAGPSREKLKAEFKEVLSKFPMANGKALEIGAGNGQFLSLLEDLGFDATGLEHNKKNVDMALSTGQKVISGYLLDMFNLNSEYNFIVCNNFMEHQPNIKKFLRRIYQSLLDGGLVYISVPNLQRIMDRACFYEFVVDHLVYFSRKTLKVALELTGFNVKQVYFKNNNNDIVIIAQKRIPRNMLAKKKKMDSIVESIRILVESLAGKGKKVSVWGAGHRALALMAIAKLEKIDFVLDSALFKQNKYTPLLNKKIVSPEYFLSHEKCDYLIVMLPGSLAEQVRNYLKDKNFGGKVLYFRDEKIGLEM